MSIKHRVVASCPVCGVYELDKAADTFEIVDILERWEGETGTALGETVWQDYAPPMPQQVALYNCDGCGFAFFQPAVSGSQSFYEEIAAEEQHYYVAEKWEFSQAANDLKRYGRQKVLDIGCGSGFFLDALRDNAPKIEIAGYEFSLEAAESARSRGHTVHHGPFPQVVLPGSVDQPYDAVCMLQVLEHLPDPIEFLQKVRTVLSPDGICIISVPNAAGPIRHFSSALTEIPPHHVSRWRESTFQAGMPRLGFLVVKVESEPLPHYLWDSYLPVILKHDLLPRIVGRALNGTGATRLIIQILTLLGVRWLPGIPGHTLYAVLQREAGS